MGRKNWLSAPLNAPLRPRCGGVRHHWILLGGPPPAGGVPTGSLAARLFHPPRQSPPGWRSGVPPARKTCARTPPCCRPRRPGPPGHPGTHRGEFLQCSGERGMRKSVQATREGAKKTVDEEKSSKEKSTWQCNGRGREKGKGSERQQRNRMIATDQKEGEKKKGEGNMMTTTRQVQRRGKRERRKGRETW